jgi:hypothetical protein
MSFFHSSASLNFLPLLPAPHHPPHLVLSLILLLHHLLLFSHYDNRCIGTTDRSDGYLRQQLEEWLDIACEQRQYSRGAKVVLNEQNRRYVQLAVCVDCMMD